MFFKKKIVSLVSAYLPIAKAYDTNEKCHTNK